MRVYSYDKDGLFCGYHDESSDYVLGENETTVTIDSGLYDPIVFDKNTKTWNSSSEKQWKEEHPENVEPSKVQQIVMQQAMAIAQMQQMLMQQNKDIAELKGADA